MQLNYPKIASHQLIDGQQHNTLVLCVNNRQARRLLATLNSFMTSQEEVISIPQIMPVSAWLMSIVEELVCVPDNTLGEIMLDDFSARLLWQEAISNVETEHSLINLEHASRMADNSRSLLHEWNIRVEHTEITPDYERFLIWQKEYENILLKLNADDKSSSLSKLLDNLELISKRFIPKRIVLSGFKELSPRLRKVISSLEQQGAHVFELESQLEPATSVQRVLSDNPYDEWNNAVSWALSIIESEPNSKVAIVVPNLELWADYAHRVIGRAFRPLGHSYNIALARPLVQWPVAHAALAWLELASALASGPVPVSLVGAALMSGKCYGHQSEKSGRSFIDAELRRKRIVNIDALELQSLLNAHTPLLADAWSHAFNILSNVKESTLENHLNYVYEFLDKLGFPGSDSISSYEWQSLVAMQKALSELTSASIALGHIPLTRAISLVSSCFNEVRFQPQRDPNARLDVLGLLEAEGGRWDAVWAMGLTDDVLPADVQPDPLIPWVALSRAEAPRSTPERELEWANQVLDSIVRSAQKVWLSSSESDTDKDLKPSPLIKKWDVQHINQEPITVSRVELEQLKDHKGPAIDANKQGDFAVKGGTGILEAQSRNPLWAFAKYRLGASQMQDYALYSDNLMRGNFLHRAMELICALVRSHDDLQRISSNNRLSALVEQAVAQAASESLQTIKSETLLRLESARAIKIIRSWLSIEEQRIPYSIQSSELGHNFHINGLQINIRLDRVDQLNVHEYQEPQSKGKPYPLVLIDYKTGKSKPGFANSWSRERLIDIQLPLYAVSQRENNIVGLVFVQLHASNVKASGVSNIDLGIDGVSLISKVSKLSSFSWDELMQHWEKSLKEIATEFVSGVAINSFYDEDDMRFCDVMPFLRLNQEEPSNE